MDMVIRLALAGVSWLNKFYILGPRFLFLFLESFLSPSGFKRSQVKLSIRKASVLLGVMGVTFTPSSSWNTKSLGEKKFLPLVSVRFVLGKFSVYDKIPSGSVPFVVLVCAVFSSLWTSKEMTLSGFLSIFMAGLPLFGAFLSGSLSKIKIK